MTLGGLDAPVISDRSLPHPETRGAGQKAKRQDLPLPRASKAAQLGSVPRSCWVFVLPQATRHTLRRPRARPPLACRWQSASSYARPPGNPGSRQHLAHRQTPKLKETPHPRKSSVCQVERETKGAREESPGQEPAVRTKLSETDGSQGGHWKKASVVPAPGHARPTGPHHGAAKVGPGLGRGRVPIDTEGRATEQCLPGNPSFGL